MGRIIMRAIEDLKEQLFQVLKNELSEETVVALEQIKSSVSHSREQRDSLRYSLIKKRSGMEYQSRKLEEEKRSIEKELYHFPADVCHAFPPTWQEIEDERRREEEKERKLETERRNCEEKLQALYKEMEMLERMEQELSKEEYVQSTHAVIINGVSTVIRDPSDDVYLVISNTYEVVYRLRNEIRRQARISFNAALGLIIAGVTIVFVGVFLFIRNNIVGGILSSVVGAVTNIIGGTIMKLYKDTNNRLDEKDADLFKLNTAKAQYALICAIPDEKKRTTELIKLIESIGNIKSNKQTVRVA